MTKAIANQAVEGTAPHWVRMNLSSDGFPAASLCKSDVNVYSVSLSLLFLIIIRIINPFHKHLPVINSGSIKYIGKSHLSIRGSQLELVSALTSSGLSVFSLPFRYFQ